MSLRDYFAAKALAGVIADKRYSECGNEAACAYEVARFSGMVADAMLAERAAKMPSTAAVAVGHIKSILEQKDREGCDIEVGSTALKSLIRWASEAHAALGGKS